MLAVIGTDGPVERVKTQRGVIYVQGHFYPSGYEWWSVTAFDSKGHVAYDGQADTRAYAITAANIGLIRSQAGTIDLEPIGIA